MKSKYLVLLNYKTLLPEPPKRQDGIIMRLDALLHLPSVWPKHIFLTLQLVTVNPLPDPLDPPAPTS